MAIGNDIDLNALGLSIGTPGSSQTRPTEESEDTFMTLMLTQLRNQDPFQPLESGEFLSQLAQFETASGIGGLQTGLTSLAESMLSNQVLESAVLVGQTVLAELSEASLDAGGTIDGAIDVPQGSSSVVMEITDTAGQVVRRIDFGAMTAGRHPFVWDGLDQSGQALPAGSYSIKANIASGDETYNGRVLLADEVRSVTLGGGGQAPILNLAGGGQIGFSEILEIR